MMSGPYGGTILLRGDRTASTKKARPYMRSSALMWSMWTATSAWKA